ncbi:MAG: sugar phosphate isomerase/epimerase family protein [Armatimonadota bacterium]
MHFAVCNEMFEEMSFEQQLATAAELGYEAVELAPFTLADSVTEISPAERDRISQQAAAAGLKIAGIHWLLVKPEGLHVTTDEEPVRERTKAYLRELVKFCADIGGEVLVFGSPKQRNVQPGVTRAMAWDWFMDAVLDCMSIPEAEQVYFCVEPLHSGLGNFLNTPREVRRLLRDIDHPRVKMILDCYSMATEGVDAPQALRESAKWLYHVHANDDNELGPGYGNVDFVPIMQALCDIQYDRYVSVEIFDFSQNTVEVARNSLEHLRKSLRAAQGGA